MWHSLSLFIESFTAFTLLMGFGVAGVDVRVAADHIVIETSDQWGISIAGCTIGPPGLQGHEYGHILQRQRLGLAYYLIVGLPSLLSMVLEGPMEQCDKWYEQQATEWGYANE